MGGKEVEMEVEAMDYALIEGSVMI